MKTKTQERKGFTYYAIIIGLSVALIIAIFVTPGCVGSKSGCPGTSRFSGYHK